METENWYYIEMIGLLNRAKNDLDFAEFRELLADVTINIENHIEDLNDEESGW